MSIYTLYTCVQAQMDTAMVLLTTSGITVYITHTKIPPNPTSNTTNFQWHTQEIVFVKILLNGDILWKLKQMKYFTF